LLFVVLEQPFATGSGFCGLFYPYNFDSLDHEAMMWLKENGVVLGFIKELFGAKYAEILNDLITVLANEGASLANDPNKYLELIAELRKYNDGLLKNIKGA
jgi:hypothetical protein